jgi:pimeloyl-ACP methyl ester carboxylesterase
MKVDIDTKIMRCAKFEYWAPEHDKKLKPLKALVVLTMGSNQDGRGMAYTGNWQAFAMHHHLGLIGTFFQDKDPTAIEGYARASEESGPALLWAIRKFGEDLKEPLLERVPLLLWGHSAGGQFNYEMNASFPERVGAFVVNKGGIYYTALQSVRARQNPGLFFIGKKDDAWRQLVVKGLLSVNNRGGADWQLVEEECAHGEGQSERISQGWFEDILRG